MCFSRKQEAFEKVQDKYDSIEETAKGDDEAAAELGMLHIGAKGLMKGGVSKIKNLVGKLKFNSINQSIFSDPVSQGLFFL